MRNSLGTIDKRLLIRINKTHHLGAVLAPAMTYTPEGLAVLEFTLAVREELERNYTAYVAAKVFGKYAETLEPYLKEGRVVEAFGSLHQVSYSTKTGERTDTSVTVKELFLLEGAFDFWQDRKKQRLLLGGLNTVVVSGNLTQDAMVERTKTGDVTRLRVAVKDEAASLFINVTYWHALELSKGQGVSLSGRLLSDSYLNKKKKRMYTTYLEVTRINKLARLKT
jgi:single-strand DNA-binding protein